MSTNSQEHQFDGGFPQAEGRLKRLKAQISAINVSPAYRAALLVSLIQYGPQILSRPVTTDTEEGWSDFEALQQVTLGNAVELWLKSGCVNESALGFPEGDE